MIAKLAKDPIARIVVLLWLGISALYFIPGVPADFLERLGDRYSTLPLWPWAAAACLYALGRTDPARRFWILQALSFAALLAIEVPWALARAGNTTSWNIAAEWCYFAFYACQLASIAPARRNLAAAVLLSSGGAIALSLLAVWNPPLYNMGRPSYLTYLAFDLLLTTMFWQKHSGSAGAWRTIYAGMALAFAVVFVTDTLDWLSYEERLNLVAGMKSDILWTLPPLCFALTARAGRITTDAAS